MELDPTPPRKNKDRRQNPRPSSQDRRNPDSEEIYPVNPEFSEEIEIVEDKSQGTALPLSKIIEDREHAAYEEGKITYTPFHSDHAHSNTSPTDIEKLKSQLRSEIMLELTPAEPRQETLMETEDPSSTLTSAHPTPEEAAIPIKPFVKKRRPGRPSSLPKESETDQWPRKTYRFNKSTLKRLKIHQASLDDHKDLSILINEALNHWLDSQGIS